MFGNPETTTGGSALKFYASVRLDIRRIETIKNGTDAIGIRVRVKVVKNKVAPPFRAGRIRHHVQRGHFDHRQRARRGTELGIVKKTGSWFSFGDERIGQGRENSKEFLKANPDVLEEIRSQIVNGSPELSGRITFNGSDSDGVMRRIRGLGE